LTASYRQRLGELAGLRSALAAPMDEGAAARPNLQAGADLSVVPPILRVGPGSLVTAADYPARALRSHEEGRTTVSVHVDASGRPVGCAVTGSSGYDDLDRATCRLLLGRARYYPATARTGRPVEADVTQSVMWRMPG
jgi:TonB family protein